MIATMIATTELETIEAGWTVIIETYELSKGVTLKIYDNKEATLNVNGGEIPFKWSQEVERAFNSLDKVTGAQLLAVIAGASL